MEPRSFNRGDHGGEAVQRDQVWLQWSHGRLTVVTQWVGRADVPGRLLQWSHGRLTVVTNFIMCNCSSGF